MLFSLLDEGTGAGKNWVSYVLIGVLVVILVVSMVVMNRRSKKRDAEDKARRDAVGPGNKVTTIGGVCGIVVEVNPEDDTFILETGSEASGKCYMKFVRQAILESDAFTDEKKIEKHGNEESVTKEVKEVETTETETPAAEVTEPATETKTEIKE